MQVLFKIIERPCLYHWKILPRLLKDLAKIVERSCQDLTKNMQLLAWSYRILSKILLRSWSCQDHVKILAWFHQDLVKILPRFPTWEINVIIITSQQHDNSHGWRNSIDHTFCNRTALVHKAFTKTCRSRKASSACSCFFFSFTPPKFSSHTCCKVAAILFTKILAHSVNHLGRGASLQVMLMCWWMTDDHHPDQSFARHQNARHPKCCTKPLLSLLLLVSAPFQLLPLLFTRLCS